MKSNVERSRMRWSVALLLVFIALAMAFTPDGRVQAANSVNLTSLTPPNQTVGTTITWLATPEIASDSLVYQFSIAVVGGEFKIVRDYSVFAAFQWTPMEEGLYEIRVVLKDRANGDTATAISPYTVLPVVTGANRAVASTINPLVALYSMPSCDSGYVRVRYRAQADLFWQYTHWRLCKPGKTINFHVAGMRATTTYEMQDEWLNGTALQRSSQINHTSGTPSVTFPKVTISNPADSDTSLLDKALLMSPWYAKDMFIFPFATDLWGRVIWYYPNLGTPWQFASYLVRPVYGGTMLLVVNYLDRVQGLREIDLAGNTLRETNTTAVNEQLAALGHDSIISFHHDAVRLANGRTLVLANVERIVQDVQGTGPVHILGDMVIELDQNWQVTWVWNSLDQLDLHRAAVLGETCLNLSYCPPLKLGTGANDWTHSNTIDYVPSDGSLLVSMRNQDWVIKLDYQHGMGDGAVLWRLGRDGDFQYDSGDPYPWFSHQHDSRFFNEDTLTLLDNGNTRCDPLPLLCSSRGQVIKLDEVNRTATLLLNVDLNLYVAAWGNAGRLTNGNYHFTYSPGKPPFTRSLEVKPDGTPVFLLETQAALYRSFRMLSLYVPEVRGIAASATVGVAGLPVWEVAEPEEVEQSSIFLPYVDARTE